ncbi:MAG: serine hydrolase, partial [Solirubrobacterales bacterium]
MTKLKATNDRSGLLLVSVLMAVFCATFFGLASISSAAPGDGACSVTPKPPAGSTGPFEGVCDYLSEREGVQQAAIFDNRTDDTYLLTTGNATQYTASIAKADILAMWLNKYESQGVNIPDGIPYSIRYLMSRMINNSDNAAATALFHFGGGCSALKLFNRKIPMNDTQVGCESQNYYGWGNTQTTAADQLKLMKLYAYDNSHGPTFGRKAKKRSTRKCQKIDSSAKRKACVKKVERKFRQITQRPILGDDARAFGNSLLQGVESDQRFGLTCGPWGTTCNAPNWATPTPGSPTVRVKNGWKTLPTCTDPIPQCPWQVNS